MMNKDLPQMWGKFARQDNWREYILPGRTTEQFHREGKEQAAELQKYIGQGDKVLEYGCGIGRVLRHIKAGRRIGVDVCREFLDKITDPGIEKVHTDGVTLEGVEPDSVDFIYSLMVFQHSPKSGHVQTLRNLLRVLRPGGRLLVQFPRQGDFYRGSDFVNTYTRAEIKEMARAAGIVDFAVVEGDLIGYADGETGQMREFFLFGIAL